MRRIIIGLILMLSMLSVFTSCDVAEASSSEDIIYHPFESSSGRWSEIESVNICYYARNVMLPQEEFQTVMNKLTQIEIDSVPIQQQAPEGGALAAFEVVYSSGATIKLEVYYELYYINDICFLTPDKALNSEIGEVYSDLVGKYM